MSQVCQAPDEKVAAAMQLLESMATNLGQPKIEGTSPNCEAEYQVVRVEAPPTHDDPLLSCGGPLRNREGKYALKYFRTDGSKHLNNRKPKLI